MPIRGVLVHPRDAQQFRLAEMSAPASCRPIGSGLSPGGESARKADPRDARDVARHREDVAQIHLQRIAGLFAGFERRRRAGRAENHVALLERLVEVALDQRAHLQGLHVIRVVIAAGQGVRADHDSALHFFAETLGARLGEQLDDVLHRLLGAMAEMHAVVAGEIARRLARGDHVIRGDAIFGVRQRHIDQLRAQLLIFLHRRIDGGLHLRIHAADEVVFLGDADAQALRPAVPDPPDNPARRCGTLVRILRIVAARSRSSAAPRPARSTRTGRSDRASWRRPPAHIG